MNAEVSAPRMQGGDDPGFCSEILWIGEQFFKRHPRGRHQQAGKQIAIELPEDIQLFGHSEDDVSMITGKEIGRGLLQPVSAPPSPALRTGSMPAGVKFQFGQLSTVTRFEMRTKVLGTALHHLRGRPNHIAPKFAMSGPRTIEASYDCQDRVSF